MQMSAEDLQTVNKVLAWYIGITLVRLSPVYPQTMRYFFDVTSLPPDHVKLLAW